MQGPSVKIGGRQLLFATTGEVAEKTAAATTAVGSWRSDSTEGDNRIRYTIGGQAQPPLPAAYRFNERNQLTVKLSGDDSVPSEFTLQGRISMARDHNVSYFLLKDDGSDTGIKIAVYVEKFDFAEGSNNLVLTLVGGGTAEITGESGVQSLEAERNHLASFRGDDLLTFQAVTRNPAGDDFLSVPAELDFVGNFDLQGDQLVFISEVKTGPRPNVSIGFAGKIKAVTAGFVYFADGNTTEVALNIRGQHTFKSTNAVTDLTWETSIGFSNKTFRAAVEVDLTRTTAKGGILDLNGKLKLEKQDGKAPEFDLQLQARYRFNSKNILVFEANVVGGDRPRYDLMLEGTFVYSNLKLHFNIQYTNKSGAPALRAEVGLQGSKNSMVQMLRLVLDLSSDNEAKLKLNLSFEVRLRFANGVRIKEAPKALASGTAAG